MPKMLIFVGILCLLFFVILALKRVDFCIIWIPVGLLFLGSGTYWRYCILHPDGFRIPMPVMAACGMMLAAALAFFVCIEALIIRQMFIPAESDLEYVIVLGAQVRNAKPSRALLRRLEAAQQYLTNNPETIAVLSGGQGPEEEISEAQCMYDYLTAHGIPQERLLMENRSTTTYENLQFSAQVIADSKCAAGAETTAEQVKHDRIGLLSNNFHIYRALYLGRKTGYDHISGIPAKSDWRLQVHYLVREFFAYVKAIV